MSSLSTCEAESGLPLLSTRLSDMTFVAFDVETTGLSPIACRLVELSGVKFNLLGEEVETFSTLVNPGQPIPSEVSALHGITDSMVQDSPTAALALADFFKWLGDRNAILMAHNANFDVEFIKVEALRSGRALPKNLVLDTLLMAQGLISDCANYKLKTLSEYFGFGGSLYHRALDDSIYVEKLFRKLLLAGQSPPQTLEHLQATGALSVFGDCPQVSGRERLSAAARATLTILEQAIGGENQVKITYHSEFKSTRVVVPKAVIDSRGSVYLNAYCLKSQAERTFRVDRIVEAIFVNRRP